MSKIKQATKKTGRARKEQIVAELTQKFDSSNGLVFTDYKGLTHKQLEDLKKELKKLDSSMVIAKNSLVKLSLGKSQKFAEFKENEGLDLPTATLFIKGDMVEPLKKLQKAIKDFGLPKIKFAILEGNLIDEAGVLKIASLPNRETLIAQFVGTLNSPIRGLVVTLNGNIQKFVMTLDAVAKTKPVEPSNQPLTIKNQESEETAVSASEPATQPESPVETDETPGEPIAEKSEAPSTKSETNSNDQNTNE